MLPFCTETVILGNQEQETIKKEQNQEISCKLSTCSLLIPALLWNVKEPGSNPCSDFHTAIQIWKMLFQSRKASFKSCVFQKISGYDQPIFSDEKTFVKNF